MAGWWIYLASFFSFGKFFLSNIKFTLEANSSRCLDVAEYAKKQWCHEQTNNREVITARQWSCGKVMFSQELGYLWCQVLFLVPGLMSFLGVRYLWSHAPSGGGYTLPPLGYPTPWIPYSLPEEATWDHSYLTPSPEPQKWVVRTLLECLLVNNIFIYFPDQSVKLSKAEILKTVVELE